MVPSGTSLAAPGRIARHLIKIPKTFISSSVSQYNEILPWEMVFNVSRNDVWATEYEAIWRKVKELLRQTGEPLSNGKYPVSTRRCFNVVDVETTLLQRQNDVMCLLGMSLPS